jgi:hypothetical protein
MRRQEDLASSQPHAVHRDVDDGSGFFSVTFTRAKCRSVHSRWGTRKQTVLLANARSSDSNAGYVGHKNKQIPGYLATLASQYHILVHDFMRQN